MQILLAAATAKEISPFLEVYNNKNIKASVDVLITGIGLTATAYHLTKQITIKKPDLILQAGVSGCFKKNISLGSVVAISADTIADQSVIELKKLKSLFDLSLVPGNQYPFHNGWLVNSNKALLQKIKLKKVKAISVNQITTSNQMIKYYEKEFQPVIESMEGAALHYVSLMEKIPFIQIRSVSNYIGERDKKKWNMKEAIIDLNKELIKIVESFKN